jgi:hypothetical protein
VYRIIGYVVLTGQLRDGSGIATRITAVVGGQSFSQTVSVKIL